MSKSKRSATRPADPKPDTTAASDSHSDEELLHVPKWTSGWRFYLMLGLMVFVLVIFVVPDQFMGLFTSRTDPGSQVYASWNHPEAGKVDISLRELTSWRREIDDFFYAQGMGRVRFEDSDLVRMLLMMELARENGIYVSDQDLGRAILEGGSGTRGFGSKDVYLGSLAQAGVSAKQYERTLRKVMVANRFQGLLAAAIGFPDMEDVERTWKEAHPQYAFDYVAVAVEDLRSDPAVSVPDDEELKGWYDGLEQFELRQKFGADYTPETIRAHIAAVRADEEPPAALLEAYPAAEDVDPEAQAREYYDTWTHVRFKRAEQKEDAAEARDRLYLPFDEVAETARREAPVYHALGAWRESLVERAGKGETIDFAAEAADLGLSVHPADEARTIEAWRADDTWGGDFLANAVSTADRTTGLPGSVTVQADGLYLVHVAERVPSQPPAFVDARERVVEEWQKQRAGEIAVERLTAVRDGLGERPAELGPDEDWNPTADPDTFAQAVADAGFTLQTKDWYDPRAQMAMPVVSEDPVEQFFLFNPLLTTYQADVVPPAELSFQGDTAFLLRAHGKREPEELDINPNEFAALCGQAGNQAVSDFSERELASLKWFEERYGLWINPEFIETEETPESEEPVPAS